MTKIRPRELNRSLSTLVNQKRSRSTENIFFESLCSFLTFYQLFKHSRPTVIRVSTTRDSQLTRLYSSFDIRDSPASAHSRSRAQRPPLRYRIDVTGGKMHGEPTKEGRYTKVAKFGVDGTRPSWTRSELTGLKKKNRKSRSLG